jgi:hypothetical protein
MQDASPVLEQSADRRNRNQDAEPAQSDAEIQAAIRQSNRGPPSFEIVNRAAHEVLLCRRADVHHDEQQETDTKRHRDLAIDGQATDECVARQPAACLRPGMSGAR